LLRDRTSEFSFGSQRHNFARIRPTPTVVTRQFAIPIRNEPSDPAVGSRNRALTMPKYLAR
jgi:hypothetical protein